MTTIAANYEVVGTEILLPKEVQQAVVEYVQRRTKLKGNQFVVCDPVAMTTVEVRRTRTGKTKQS